MTISYFEAILTGLIQGVTELFPISSLGHAVIIPGWIGGDWAKFTSNSEHPSQYLNFIIVLHLASAVALFWVFRKRWTKLIFNGLTGKRNSHSRTFWLLVIATIPVGLIGLIFEHQFRVLFAVPIYASIFITLNGLILIAAEKRAAKNKTELGIGTEDEIIPLRIKPLNAVVIGLGESLALFAGISRSGITTSIGLARNLSHHVAADFAFLAAFPVISIAAVYKLPEALSSENHLIFGQMVVGSVVAFISTYFSVTFLIRWFKSRTLYPFAIYCIIFGIASIIKFS